MITTDYDISLSELKNWFTKKGFAEADFVEGVDYYTSYWGAQMISIKLIKRNGFVTFFKGAYGGSVLVFEVGIQNNKLVYDCYCPIWLFGFWNKKLTFKRDASGIFKYRKEGFEIQEKFKSFLENRKPEQ